MSEQPIQRKLAAVLYADVAGYSRLTGADEDATHAALRAGLASLTRAIEGRGGRVNHYAGQAMAGIAGAYFDLGEFEVSLEWAVKAERSNPNLTWPGLYLTRVATYVLLERLEDARMERDALLARHPQASLAAYHSDCSGFARCGTVTDAVRKVDFPE
jgi:tetratricopeptide (TPR) repeat protein